MGCGIDERTYKVALAMVYQGIPEEMLLSLPAKKPTKEAWALKTMCQGAERVKAAWVQTMKAELESLSMKENEHIDEFYMKINWLVTNIRALGEEVTKSYVVKKILRAVPAKFLQITSTLEQFGDLDKMTVEEVVGSLKAHEERVKGKAESSGGQLLHTEEEWSGRESEEKKLLLPGKSGKDAQTKMKWTMLLIRETVEAETKVGFSATTAIYMGITKLSVAG